jgi:soluble lytic murein transglycosylase-like protein
MNRDELIALAQKTAAAHGLLPKIFCGLVERESAWNPWSIRYEPGFYEEYVQKMLEAGAVHDETEAHGRAISWGLGQVMGETAREMGFAGDFAQLCDPEIGLEYAARILRHDIDRASSNVVAALLRYNGGGNQSYAAEVLKLSQKYA